MSIGQDIVSGSFAQRARVAGRRSWWLLPFMIAGGTLHLLAIRYFFF
ncbi:hypothetical protein [Frigidibacter oleivorans]|nr:hypothetical protein [Frigidibacter oleivorans]